MIQSHSLTNGGPKKPGWSAGRTETEIWNQYGALSSWQSITVSQRQQCHCQESRRRLRYSELHVMQHAPIPAILRVTEPAMQVRCTTDPRDQPEEKLRVLLQTVRKRVGTCRTRASMARTVRILRIRPPDRRSQTCYANSPKHGRRNPPHDSYHSPPLRITVKLNNCAGRLYRSVVA